MTGGPPNLSDTYKQLYDKPTPKLLYLEGKRIAWDPCWQDNKDMYEPPAPKGPTKPEGT